MSSSNVLNRAASLSSRRGRQTLLRQQPHRRRFLSTNMATAANDSSPPPIVPILHSRKALPRVCLDPSELNDMTEHVLSTEAGNLFQFQRNTTSSVMSALEDSKAAWNTADGTVQMVEYLMRGHAAKVPGSLWNEWTAAPSGAEDPLKSLVIMDMLLDRIWDEGHFYMTVRQKHWSQVALEDDLLHAGSNADESLAADWRKFAREDTIVNDDGNDTGWKATEASVEEDSDDTGTSGDMMEDFAMPGPSVDMYDTYLDTIASAAALVQSPENTPPLLTSKNAFATLETILSRHQLDGGDDVNTNRHTLPTQISYNAVMRTAANLPFESGDDLSSAEVYRDWAIMASFSAHDALTHAAGLERNSSTYAYLLQVVAKYMPPSTYRGNVARGLWKLAKTNGVYNAQVQEALLLANATSNGPDHDEWLDENIRGKDWRTDAPHRWRRRVQKYRMVPKQTTY